MVWSTCILISSDEPWDYLFDVKLSSYGGYVTSSLKLAELLEKYEYFISIPMLKKLEALWKKMASDS